MEEEEGLTTDGHGWTQMEEGEMVDESEGLKVEGRRSEENEELLVIGLLVIREELEEERC